MKRFLKIQDLVFRSTRTMVPVICLTLMILGIAVMAAELAFRERMRSQILEQDASILQSVGLMQHEAGQSSGEFTDAKEQPESYFDELLRLSRLRGVIGVRLFDAHGDFVNAFPFHITETDLSPSELASLKGNRPSSQFIRDASLAEIDLLASDTNAERAPILLISIPLPAKSGFVGAAQFIIQGQSIAEAWDRLDRDLCLTGFCIFVGGGSLLTLILLIAFRRLRSMNQALYAANQDLAMAARTNAVGAVAAHLIHGLKNPLSGLRSFVAESGGAGNPEWQAAIASTQRMQGLINRTVAILQERQSGVEYEITVAEMVQLVRKSLETHAKDNRIDFQNMIPESVMFSSGDANLISMILENLLQNALQATPTNRSISLVTFRADDMLHFDVCDQGPGIPAELLPGLFKPCRSTKVGGGGIGLAICKQLALHLEADIQLISSTSEGSVFRVCYPLRKTIGTSSFATPH